jgi:hypothetical protein
MSKISWNLQTAIFSALSPAVAPAVVYDDAPPEAVFPYITIGEQTSDHAGDKSDDAESVTVTIHVWSRKAGRKEVKELTAKVRQTLHNKTLTVAGADPATLRYEFSNDFLEPETMTKHGVIRFGAVITLV